MTQTRVFTIDGMSCQNCVRHVQRALSSVQDVAVNDVSIGSATVTYDPEKVTHDQVTAAIKDAGYEARPAAA